MVLFKREILIKSKYEYFSEFNVKNSDKLSLSQLMLKFTLLIVVLIVIKPSVGMLV